jgi:hypothetical protein
MKLKESCDITLGFAKVKFISQKSLETDSIAKTTHIANITSFEQ